MSARLEELLVVREAHLRSARAEYLRTAAALEELKRERAAFDDELRLIEAQRCAWERQWRHWLREDGMLRRGQEYNLYHLRLSAWEGDVREQRAEVDERHRSAEDALIAARSSLLRQQLRADLLKRELASAQHALRSQRVGRIESRQSDDLVFQGRIATQALE